MRAIKRTAICNETSRVQKHGNTLILPLQKRCRMRYILSFFLLSVSLFSCSNDEKGWKQHAVPEGNFTVEMPAPIQKAEKKEVTVFGKQVRHFVRWKPSSMAIDKFKLFEVSYTQCPAGLEGDSMKIQAILDEAVDMRKKDFSEEDEIESQAIELNGYPGRAFFYDAPKGNSMVSVKICVAGDKLYDLVTIAKKNYAVNDDMGKFFNSFKLLK